MTANLSSRPPTPAPAVGTLANVRWLLGQIPSLNVSLSKFQTVVGFTAGIISIFGALLTVPSYFKPTPGKGGLVAVVVEAKTEKAVSNATVEVLTLNNAVVTTLNSGFFGKANSTLDEGQYRIRIKHPKFGAEVRHIQIVSGQTSEVRVQLHSEPALGEPSVTASMPSSVYSATRESSRRVQHPEQPTGSVSSLRPEPRSWPYERMATHHGPSVHARSPDDSPRHLCCSCCVFDRVRARGQRFCDGPAWLYGSETRLRFRIIQDGNVATAPNRSFPPG